MSLRPIPDIFLSWAWDGCGKCGIMVAVMKKNQCLIKITIYHLLKYCPSHSTLIPHLRRNTYQYGLYKALLDPNTCLVLA